MEQGSRRTTERVIRFLQAILPRTEKHIRQKEYQEGVNILETLTGHPQIRQPDRPKMPKSMRKRRRRAEDARQKEMQRRKCSIYVPGHGAEIISLAAQKTISNLMEEGRKIQAIKALRLVTSLGLREAKETVEYRGNF